MAEIGIPGHFQLLDPAVASAAVKGIPDLLAGESRRNEAVYRQHRYCKNGCGPTMETAYGGTQFAFSDPDTLVPRMLMKCHACGFSMNPFDGMIVEMGSQDVSVHGNVPILGKAGG